MNATFRAPSLIRIVALALAPLLSFIFISPVLVSLDTQYSSSAIAFPFTLVVWWAALLYARWSPVVKSGMLLLITTTLALTRLSAITQ